MSKTILQDIIKDFDLDKFIRFFREKNRSFAPRKEELSQYSDDNFINGVKLGEIQFAQDERLLICAFEATQLLNERSGKKAQYEKGKSILKEANADAGIFIFYDRDGRFRFSLIYPEYTGTKRQWSYFKRFTYFVSSELTNKTFLQQIGEGDFSSLKKIKEAFSVEKVTKEFYTEIANWYFWAVKNVQFPKDAEKEENGRNIAVIRLITRIIFIWFMKERKLIQPALFKYKNISSLLKDLSPENTTYYKAILQNLFFATLNTKIEDRKFRFGKSFQGKNKDYMDHGIYRYEDYFKNKEDMLEIFKDIPFLNGGLFDCLDRRITENGKNIEIRVDGFTDKEVGVKAPNKLFFSDEKNVDLNEDYGTTNKKFKIRGLIDILSSYNFTIDENEPNDAEVALDPELLGKVFENLLASFNPETASTARKATGSYYTPREIVDYMVTQSLREYFKTHLKEIDDIDNKLDILLTHNSETSPFGQSDTLRMVALIDNLRIVDPAVGSGAFPMGVLNKLVFILAKLDPENALWKETQIKAIEDITDPILKQKLKKQIEEQFAQKNFDYGRKLYLIQKCIYGVDIQQIAVEIAKLRFFISLLVDEKIDKSKPNWGIEPLPNLDFKLIQGNSLISEFMRINLDADGEGKKTDTLFIDEEDRLITQFQNKKSEYQNEPDRDKKERLKDEIDNLIVKIFEAKLKRQKTDYFNRLAQIEKKYAVLPDEKQRNEIIYKEKEALYKTSGFNLESAEKQLKEFTHGLKVKPFFAWKLYFAEVFYEKGGFDIVIGNPPYIQLQKAFNHKIKYADIYKEQNYQTFDRTGDIYCLFYEKGMQLLNQNGLLCYITSNKWMRAGYGEKLRSYFTKYNPLVLVDLGPGVFENATVDTNILLIQKANKHNDFNLHAVTLKKENNTPNISHQLNECGVVLNKLSKDAWFIGSNAEQRLKEKIEHIGKPLKDWDVKIYRGVLTGLNEAFIITTEKRNEILANCQDEAERCRTEAIIKPILRGRDIKRYYYEWAGLWVIVIPAGWTNQNRGKEDAEKFIQKSFSSLMEYLKPFEEKAKTRDDQGDYWWELRQCAYYPEFEKEKVVYSEIVRQPQFYFDTGKFYVEATSFLMTGKNVKYICGLLNSIAVTYFFKDWYAGGGLGEEGYRYKKAFLKNLPLPPITPANQPIVSKIESLVDKILAAKKKDPSADTSALERQIDEMVYKLYGLTEDEIKIVNDSHRVEVKK